MHYQTLAFLSMIHIGGTIFITGNDSCIGSHKTFTWPPLKPFFRVARLVAMVTENSEFNLFNDYAGMERHGACIRVFVTYKRYHIFNITVACIGTNSDKHRLSIPCSDGRKEFQWATGPMTYNAYDRYRFQISGCLTHNYTYAKFGSLFLVDIEETNGGPLPWWLNELPVKTKLKPLDDSENCSCDFYNAYIVGGAGQGNKHFYSNLYCTEQRATNENVVSTAWMRPVMSGGFATIALVLLGAIAKQLCVKKQNRVSEVLVKQ